MDVDWVWDLFRMVPRPTQPNVSLSPRTRPSDDVGIRQINDHVYEVFKPVGSRPSVELVFFHGLQLEDSQVDTWLCRDASELWLNWIPNKILNARILTVSYDAHAKGTDRQGCSDMYVTTENLLQDLIGASPAGAELGQDGCPVVLVGHCLGGVVMKQFCVYASSKLNLFSERQKQATQNFLDNTKGFFFYAVPNEGIRLADLETSSRKGQLFASLPTLNAQAARQNEDFRMLCQNRGWETSAIGESHTTTEGKMKGLSVEKASSRRNVDEFYTSCADHINVCRPQSQSSSNFTKLLTFLSGVMKKARLSVHECEIPECAVGLEIRALEAQRKLVHGTPLGIFGMGGIGKTILAKKVFNNISKYFEYTCFLESVKDIRIRKLKECCFREFYFKGKKLDIPFAQFSELRDKRTLIVLDDIDSQEQLDVLPKLKHFNPESCFIFTSRDKKFSRSHENCIIHEVDFLNMAEAKKLFCFHAFGLDPIPDLLVEPVNEVVLKCAGLPLTLEVVGRYLRGYATQAQIWKETLKKLTKAVALEGKNDKVWASLEVSYDGLSEYEQEMFLEAATVFFREPMHIAFAAWSTSNRYPHTTWENLVNRSLVKALTNTTSTSLFDYHQYWTHTEQVWVHEQLRDMAKKIEDLDDGDMIFGHNDDSKLVVDLLNANKMKGRARKVHVNNSMDVALRLDSLLHLERLKILDLNEVLCEGSQKASTPDLSVLRCRSLIGLPKWWERLCCLESLCGERLSTFNINLNSLDRLAVMGIEYCVVPKDFPEALGNLTNMRILWLVDLEGLDHLPPNFGNLARLKYLGIKSFKSLKIPEEFGNLVDLECLVLSNIHTLELPESLGDLRSLVYFRIEEIDGLVGLPDTFGRHLQKLRVFEIIGCPLMKRLPSCFSELSKLERFVVAACLGLEELEEAIVKLSTLRILVLRDVAVKRLPANFARLSALEELTLQTDKFRTFSDDFVQLPALKNLLISSNELEMLPNGFPLLESLETMALVNCSKLEKLPDDFGRVSSLREVTLRNCKILKSLPDSWGKPSLPQLKLPQGRESHEVRRQAGESSQTNAREEVRLIIYGCPLLDDSMLGSLSGVHIVNEAGSERKQLDEDNPLASPPFPSEETQSWNGYWTQGTFKGDMTMELCFASNNGISGGGRDKAGHFTCTGEWRGSQVHLIKHYIVGYDVQYDGEFSNNTINGTWTIKNRISTERGEFHLEQQSCKPV